MKHFETNCHKLGGFECLKMGQKYKKMRPNFCGLSHVLNNNIGHVFSLKIVFIWVLSRPCFPGGKISHNQLINKHIKEKF